MTRRGGIPFFRSVAAAALIASSASLLAAATMGAARAQTAEASKLSPSVERLLTEASPFLENAVAADKAGDKAKAAAEARKAQPLLERARAVPNRSPYDVLVTSKLQLNAAILTKDNAQFVVALEEGLSSGMLSPKDRETYLRSLGQMALQANDMPKAMQAYERLMPLVPNDAELRIEVAELHRRNKQPAQAVNLINEAIAIQKRTGVKSQESWYRRSLGIAYDAKLPQQISATSEAILGAYPNPTNWRDVLIIFGESGQFDDQVKLDVYRLMRVNNALTGERDFTGYANLAVASGLHGEAAIVLNEGVAAGKLKGTKPAVKELMADVSTKSSGDRAALPALERQARAAPNGQGALAAADRYLGYGEYTKAADLFRFARQKGGVSADVVNTRLGLALTLAGDKVGGRAALDGVRSAPRTQLARFIRIALDQR